MLPSNKYRLDTLSLQFLLRQFQSAIRDGAAPDVLVWLHRRGLALLAARSDFTLLRDLLSFVVYEDYPEMVPKDVGDLPDPERIILNSAVDR
jgi:hypothetical protein